MFPEIVCNILTAFDTIGGLGRALNSLCCRHYEKFPEPLAVWESFLDDRPILALVQVAIGGKVESGDDLSKFLCA